MYAVLYQAEDYQALNNSLKSLRKPHLLIGNIDTTLFSCIVFSLIQWDNQLNRASRSYVSGLILGLRPANERRRYKVTPSPIGCAQT